MRIFDKIESLFGFDTKSFFVSYSTFLNEDLQNMISFYKGQSESPINISLSKLKSLIVFSKEILNKIEIYKSQFDSVEFYEWVDEVEDISLKLESYLNLKKWVGSTSVKGVHMQGNSFPYTLSKNETLESVSQGLGYSDRDAGSLELSIRNSIKETDYDLKGGFSFQVNFQGSSASIVNLKTVIDNDLTGKNLLGKDFSKNISFSSEDLQTLSPEETFSQSCKILMELKMGDNPEFPFDGIDKTLLVNRATSSTNFPIIFRQLNSLVSKDDTIRQLTLIDLKYNGDSLSLSCSFFSQLLNSKGQVYEN